MPGQIVSLPDHAHTCTDTPDPTQYLPGTVWQCDECGTQWVVVEGAQYNVGYSAWRRLTQYNKDGQDI